MCPWGHTQLNMPNIRKPTGKENLNFWLNRYGQKAGEAPMVCRTHPQGTFSSQGTDGYAITDSGSYSTNNILIHSIQFIQTSSTDDAIMEILDNRTSTTHMTGDSIRLRVLVNQQDKHNSSVSIVFPIPILCVNGGRIWKDDSTANGPLTSICYTVLESKGDIDPDKNIYLQCKGISGTSNNDVIDDSDVEVYGAYMNTTARTVDGETYARCDIKNGANSIRGVIYINEMWTRETEDEELDSSRRAQWFPYPIYLKDGMQLQGTSSGTTAPYTAIFYRKVNAKGIDHGWT